MFKNMRRLAQQRGGRTPSDVRARINSRNGRGGRASGLPFFRAGSTDGGCGLADQSCVGAPGRGDSIVYSAGSCLPWRFAWPCDESSIFSTYFLINALEPKGGMPKQVAFATDLILQKQDEAGSNTSAALAYDAANVRWAGNIAPAAANDDMTNFSLTWNAFLLRIDSSDGNKIIPEHTVEILLGDVTTPALTTFQKVTFKPTTSCGSLQATHLFLLGSREAASKERVSPKKAQIGFANNISVGVQFRVTGIPNDAAYTFTAYAPNRDREEFRAYFNRLGVSC
jgi:hypothetical protein